MICWGFIALNMSSSITVSTLDIKDTVCLSSTSFVNKKLKRLFDFLLYLCSSAINILHVYTLQVFILDAMLLINADKTVHIYQIKSRYFLLSFRNDLNLNLVNEVLPDVINVRMFYHYKIMLFGKCRLSFRHFFLTWNTVTHCTTQIKYILSIIN